MPMVRMLAHHEPISFCKGFRETNGEVVGFAPGIDEKHFVEGLGAIFEELLRERRHVLVQIAGVGVELGDLFLFFVHCFWELNSGCWC